MYLHFPGNVGFGSGAILWFIEAFQKLLESLGCSGAHVTAHFPEAVDRCETVAMVQALAYEMARYFI